MLRHMRVLLSLILVFTPVAIAGNKKKHMLPAYVINARTVVVLIGPAGRHFDHLATREQDCSTGCRKGIDEMGAPNAGHGNANR